MTNKWIPFLTVFFIIVLAIFWQKRRIPKLKENHPLAMTLKTDNPLWSAPDSNFIPDGDAGRLIRYGKLIIRHTSRFFGTAGSVGHLANNMNCGNCHLEAGTKPWAGNFGSVASLYPRFSDRKGSFETINQRIIDCFERSMNGEAPDSNSREMIAMNAYIEWIGKDVEKGKKPVGAGLEQLAYLNRPADTALGKTVYARKCSSCHGTRGEGLANEVAAGYKYPPLWGMASYNTAAGLYRLSKFAGFIKDNMPFGADYKNEQLSTEEAWDLAAFVNSQPRPVRKFKNDWPIITLKPVDLPEGPFSDSFPSSQHKFGPFAPIAKYKDHFGKIFNKNQQAAH